MRHVLLVLCAVALLAFAPPAQASYTVAVGVQRPALRVDAAGNAEVSWTAAGRRRTVLITVHGSVRPGARLAARDVGRAATAVTLPFAKVVRRTPDGRLWALQEWRTATTGLLELHFARWRGAPTGVTLTMDDSGRLAGSATFAGKPVTGFSSTLGGKRFRHYAYLDCLGCPAGQEGAWTRMLGTLLRADGTFRALLRPEWTAKLYRATVVGPNPGTTLAPDGSATYLVPPPPAPITTPIGLPQGQLWELGGSRPYITRPDYVTRVERATPGMQLALNDGDPWYQSMGPFPANCGAADPMRATFRGGGEKGSCKSVRWYANGQLVADTIMYTVRSEDVGKQLTAVTRLTYLSFDGARPPGYQAVPVYCEEPTPVGVPVTA